MQSELRELLHVLEEDPAIGALAEHIRAVHSLIATWSVDHCFMPSPWDFGYPAVRATARHPLGGVAAIECLLGTPPNVQLFVYHWVDEASRAIRHSWREQFAIEPFQAASLLRRLDEAIAHLLGPPEPSAYRESAVSLDLGPGESAVNGWSGLKILR
jgi:hypothetical protein